MIAFEIIFNFSQEWLESKEQK